MTVSILIIDDDPVICRLLRILLEQSGYDVWTADSVAAAWNLLEQKQPHVICCDLMMPETNGLELLARLRHAPALAAIPVIVLTGAGQQRWFDEALQLGAFTILSKPFNKDDLLAAVELAHATTFR